MGRHAEELEAERTYELIKKEKEENGTFIKSFLRFLFSQLGLVLVVVGVAVGGNGTIQITKNTNKIGFFNSTFKGALLYISIELPNEQILYAQKQDQARKIIGAENYMAAAFWSYTHDLDTYNYSYTQ